MKSRAYIAYRFLFVGILGLMTFILITNVGCGRFKVDIADPHVSIDDPTVTVEGGTESFFVIRLEFLSQLIGLCEDLVLDEDYESLARADQARAECVFDKLGLIQIPFDNFEDFDEEAQGFCANPPASLTAEQLQDYNELCTGIGFGGAL